MITLPRVLKSNCGQLKLASESAQTIWANFRIIIAVQTISHGRKLKCYLKEKKSRKSIGSHIRGQTVTEYLSNYLATL